MDYLINKQEMLIKQGDNKLTISSLLDLCSELDVVEVGMPFVLFRELTKGSNYEFHRSGSGFPYIMADGILIVSASTKDFSKKYKELNADKVRPGLKKKK